MYAKWIKGPAGYYIAHLQVGNKNYYASGRTADICERNIKATAYAKERISQRQVHLEQSPSEELDTQFASNAFKRKFLTPKDTKVKVTKVGTIITTPKPQYEHVSEIDPKTGELVVYEIREIARYKMKNRENFITWAESEQKDEETAKIMEMVTGNSNA